MRKIFKAIYKLIDNILIVPISRFIYFFRKKMNKSRGSIDKYLNNPKFLLYLSLILAAGCFFVIDSKVINLVESQAEVISNVAVKVQYNNKVYVVEGVPETVDITISGRKSDIYLAKQLGDYEVILDLTDYTASDSPYKVEFEYTKSVDNLTYKLDPSYASVIIKEKISDTATLSYDLLNVDELDPTLSVKNVVLEKTEVAVKGSEDSLAEIASVRALVDLSDNILKEAGTYTLEDTKLVAYDNSGNILENVEIVPGTVNATVTLDSYKVSLPLSVQTSGNLIAGKAIAAIQIDGKDSYSIDVYGEKEDLDKLTMVPVTIDIDGLGKDSVKNYNVSLAKPSGVRYMSQDNIKISVTFGNEEQKTINIGNKITPRGLEEGSSANIISSDSVNVQVKGVASVINNITEENINAYVDLAGLTTGDHEVQVKVENNDPMVNYVVSTTIQVRIS